MQKFRTRWLSVGTAPIVGGNTDPPCQHGAVTALVIGLALLIVGTFMDSTQAHRWLIGHITSRSLGTLAPGYAASDRGLRTYTGLVRAVGIVVLSFWILSWSVEVGGLLLLAGVGGFIYLSIKAIRGEVTTFRALKR